MEPIPGAHNLLWDMNICPGMNSRFHEPRFQGNIIGTHNSLWALEYLSEVETSVPKVV